MFLDFRKTGKRQEIFFSGKNSTDFILYGTVDEKFGKRGGK